MIDSVGMYKKATNLVEKYGTRNTLQLSKELGVEIVVTDTFDKLLGMYICKWRHRVIFLNDKMSEPLTQIVTGHELGHDIYHRELAKKDGLKEFELYRMQDSTEYEANAFASHILIDTDECLEHIRNGDDIVHLSQIMKTEINLMLIKLQELNRLGYNLKVPSDAQADFLKKVRIKP